MRFDTDAQIHMSVQHVVAIHVAVLESMLLEYMSHCVRVHAPHVHTHTHGHTHTHITYTRAHVRARVLSEYTVLQSMCTTVRIHNGVRVYNNTQYELACPEICK